MNDLISRQAAIDALAEEFYYNEEDYRTAVKAIGGLPSAQQWIPCSERLPEIGDKVLVSTKNTVFAEVFKGTHESVVSWWWTNNTIKIIYAWMPLPEPYKEGEA